MKFTLRHTRQLAAVGLGLAGSLVSLSVLAATNSEVSALHITESDLQSLLGTNTVFSAVGKVGDAAGASGRGAASSPDQPFELGLGYSTEEPASTRNFNWKNSGTETFWFNYDANNNKISYSLGGETMKYMASQPYGFSDLFVRTYAANSNESFLSNLTLNGQSLGSAYSNGGGSDILRIKGLDFSHSFSLTGNAMLTWEGLVKPNDAGFQLQFVQAVPEPAEFLMLLAGLGVVTAVSRLRGRLNLS